MEDIKVEIVAAEGDDDDIAQQIYEQELNSMGKMSPRQFAELEADLEKPYEK